MNKKNMKNTIETMAFSSIKAEPIIVPSLIDVKGSSRFVKYGNDNKLPAYLYDCFLSVSNLQSILLTYSDYICGSNINTDYAFLNSDDETIQEVIKKAVMDYCIFGSFALECIRNANGDICNVLYQDVRNIRISEDFMTAYISNEWGSFQAKNTVELPLWKRKEKQPHFIFYWNGNSRGWYGTPLYFAALKSVEILKRTRDFHLKNLENNFSANCIITFCNGIPSKTVQEEIFEKLNNQFCGTENASKLFINFADNQESAPKIERLTEDKFGELYKTLQESSVDDLFVACRINPILLGKNDTNGGFNKQEYSDAHKLFNKTVINPIQNNIEHALSKIGINITIEEYNIDLD